MTTYKGYTVDGIIFKSKNEIYEFVKTQTLDKFKWLCRKFADTPTMEIAEVMTVYSDKLHKEFNMDFATIEAIECAEYGKA